MLNLCQIQLPINKPQPLNILDDSLESVIIYANFVVSYIFAVNINYKALGYDYFPNNHVSSWTYLIIRCTLNTERIYILTI